MEEDDIDRDGDEVATGENRNSLDEGIQGVKGKSSERSHCLGLVMDEMQIFVYLRMVQQTMEPVSEELIIHEVNEQVKRKERR